ncbi:MAG: sigma-54 dependent transcriptional regulator [Planctomycetota bacterium]
MSNERVLLIDADPRAWGDLPERLLELGAEVALETSAEAAASRILEADWDVLCAEIDLLGRRVLELAGTSPGRPEVLLFDTFGSDGEAAQAMRAGAFDVLARPASVEKSLLGVQRALERRRTSEEIVRLRRASSSPFGGVLTRDESMERALELVRSVADTKVTLLLEGESGSGKTLVARALHDASPRRDEPFVVVNCGALPDALLESELFGHVKGAFTGATSDRSGLFETADGGTLFLDEVNSASLDLQVKLLRVLETGEFEPLGSRTTRRADVRVVAASNSDLREEVAEGRFRDDLYWRLKVVSVVLPPLRERPGDVPLLAADALLRAAEEHGRPARELSTAAIEVLLRHSWPGNVRELRHAMERAALVCGSSVVEVEHLPPDVRGDDRSDASDDGFGSVPLGPLRAMLEVPERAFLLRALAACGGSRSRTAELLDVNRGTLFNKMRRYGLMSYPSTPARPGDGTR